MNKSLKYIILSLVSVLALGSCTEEYDYTGAKVEGEQVYFRNDLDETVELTATESSFQVPVNRVNTSGQLTLQLNVSTESGSILTVPSSVTFADGEDVAYLTIEYDNTQIEYGKYETVTLSLADESYASPYGSTSYTFEAGMSEWKPAPSNSSDGEEGVTYYRDGLMSAAYALDALTYKVSIEESVVTPGRYRLVNPYGSSTSFYSTYGPTGTGDFTLEDGDHYIIIDATDPDYVYIDGAFNPGVKNPDDGSLLFFSYVTYYQVMGGYDIATIKANAPQYFGQLKDGVITMPAQSILLEIGSTEITGSGTYYANDDGLFAVALPGYEITDYSSSFTYTGRFTDTANNDYAQGTITLGADVASAKYVVAADGDDVNAIIDGLNDGSIEGTSITAGGSVSLQLTESGTYTMVIVTYDSEGNMKGSSTTQFTFTLSSDVTEADWQPLYTGTFQYNWMPNFVVDNEDNYVGSIYERTDNVVLYYDASTSGKYRIYPWASSEDGLVFTMDDEGAITFDGLDTGDTYGQYGAIYASDAHTLYPTDITSVTSFYSQEEKAMYFGTMYYVSAGLLAGSYELFTITGDASQSPAKVKAIESQYRGKLSTRPLKLVRKAKFKAARAPQIKRLK